MSECFVYPDTVLLNPIVKKKEIYKEGRGGVNPNDTDSLIFPEMKQ